MTGQINALIQTIDEWVWGIPLILLILTVGIFLTIRLKGLQIRHLPKALKFMIKNEEGGTGEISSFGALCTALSATIGTGNIVGVATALVLGGPGALFWMWVAAFFGMATKYAEGLLAVKYRHISEDGHVLGGPYYYIEKGMGKKWRWLGMIFAFFGACVGLFGIGTFTQVNGITDAVKNFFDPSIQHVAFELFGHSYSWSVVISGAIITLCTALVVIGGIKRISSVSLFVVPFMAIIYVVICLLLLGSHVKEIPGALYQVVSGAFGVRAAAGGAFGAMFIAMQKGIARGIFSNEAGLGSAPIAAAAAKTNSCVRQGLVSMTGTFIDTIIICTLTGLCIVITGAWNVGLKGVAVTTRAFESGLFFPNGVSAFLLMICLVFFAFTTILGWDYYGEKCLEYLSGGNQKLVMVYRWMYILAVFAGPYMTVEAVWNIADIFNGLMALPNLIGIVSLSGVVVRETKQYFEKYPTLR